MKTNPDGTYTHPKTGVVHFPAATGWEPPLLAVCVDEAKDRWLTECSYLPDCDLKALDACMEQQAEALSQITGVTIRWHRVVDAIGWDPRIGFFVVGK